MLFMEIFHVAFEMFWMKSTLNEIDVRLINRFAHFNIGLVDWRRLCFVFFHTCLVLFHLIFHRQVVPVSFFSTSRRKINVSKGKKYYGKSNQIKRLRFKLYEWFLSDPLFFVAIFRCSYFTRHVVYSVCCIRHIRINIYLIQRIAKNAQRTTHFLVTSNGYLCNSYVIFYHFG